MAGNMTRVWDIPLRLFHWALAGSFTLAWLMRGDQTLYFHLLAGYLFTALLLFRLIWGFTGGRHARFKGFLYGAGALVDYLKAVLKGAPRRYLGHNPAGSWAVYAILLLGLLLGTTGVIALGAEERHGPLAGILDFEQGALFHSLHESLAWALLFFLVLLHLAGVLVESLLHRENLPLAMITGFKPIRGEGPYTDTKPRLSIGLVMLASLLLFSAWWLQGYLMQTGEQPYLPFAGPDLPHDPLWQEECGACHMAYHPSLLPARSWERILQSQADHFAEDLSLEAETIRQLMDYATRNAAEATPAEASWKILHSISADNTPLRITQTQYWKEKHSDIPGSVWRRQEVNGRYNCDACHLDAEQGGFQDGAMRIPGGRERSTNG